MKKRNNSFFLFFIFLFFGILPNVVYSQEAKISIDCSQELGEINPLVFGNNLIAYDPKTYENGWVKEYYGYSDFGAGIWDSFKNKPQPEVIKLAKDVGITVVRFPGGCGAHHYNWKEAIGKKRRHFLFGIDEFLKVAQEIGAEPIFTLSFYAGDENDAADLVEYLNLPDDGKNNWARQRAMNGRKEPYNVRYFEVGNEEWHGNHKDIKELSAEEYAQKYLKYYRALKAKDPKVLVGVILYKPEWNKKVLEIVGKNVDFGIIHTYPSAGRRKDLETMEPKTIYALTLAKPILRDKYTLAEALVLLKEKAGKDIPLAITEYNGGFVQDKPVPYRHCLGTALLNAELLRLFTQPENNILFANYWNFCNEYWGMVANGFDGSWRSLYNPYYKRPNYFVFELYHKHFGDILLEAKVRSDGYDASQYQPIKALIAKLKTGTLIRGNLLPGAWVIRPASGVIAQEKSGVLELEFAAEEEGKPKTYNYYHSIKQAQVEPDAYYKLSGWIKTENLVAELGVCLEVQDSRGWNATKSAASTEKISGSTDWTFVEVIYQTLPDAKAVNVIARRVGEKGPLSGKAYFKDVRLEKFVPSVDTKIPYLSVNASKSKDGKKVYLMVINKNMDSPITATVELKGFLPANQGKSWVLNGPSIDATNEKKHDNVKVVEKSFNIPACKPEDDVCRFEYTFDEHSLTAIEVVLAHSS